MRRADLRSALVLLLLLVGFVAPLACRTTQSVGTQVDDSVITSKVNAKLAADPNVRATDVSVQTDEGIVTLTGRVKEASARTEAEKLVRETSGVRGVRNFIKVGDMEPPKN